MNYDEAQHTIYLNQLQNNIKSYEQNILNEKNNIKKYEDALLNWRKQIEDFYKK